jgi:transposase
MPHCNGDTFQIFINQFAAQNPNEFKIILLDNGRFHKAKDLIIPQNVVLLFLPPYSPELNPAEKIWWKMKREFSGKLNNSLDDVSDFIKEQVNKLSKSVVKSICAFDYLFSCKLWSNT